MNLFFRPPIVPAFRRPALEGSGVKTFGPSRRQSDHSKRGEEHPGWDFVRSYLGPQTKMSKHPIPFHWVIVWKVNYEAVASFGFDLGLAKNGIRAV